MREFVQIRFEDIDAVSQVDRTSFSQKWPAAYFRSVLAAPNTLCVGAVERGELGAYVLGFVEERRFYLSSIAVAPGLRRRGWGEALLRYALGQARKCSCASAQLEVRVGNAPALSLYQKMGFTLRRRMVDHYDNPREDGLELVLGLQ